MPLLSTCEEDSAHYYQWSNVIHEQLESMASSPHDVIC